MQNVNSDFQAELAKGQDDPRVLLDVYELYDNDAVPGVDGFDPADAEETFAAQEITWNGIAYRRELKSRGDISRSMGEKTNNVTLNFSNISRYMASLAQTVQLEGKILLTRTIAPAVETDSLSLFVGRADKPGDITKGDFSLSARQDFGNINVTVPTSQYVAEDPNGLQPGNPLYEGIRFVAQSGFGPGGMTTVPSKSFFGRLFGRTKRVAVSEAWSSLDFTPYGEVIREIFGTMQVQAVPIMFSDIGYWLNWLGAWCKGPIKGVTNIQLKNFDSYGLYDVQTHTGEIGGTGDAIVRDPLVHITGGNITEDFRFPGSGLFSRLAFSGISILHRGINDEPIVITEPPVIVGLVQGRRIDLPDGSGAFNRVDWSDNPAYIARFLLTNDRFANINPAFMDDAVIYRTGLHCDEPLIDTSNTQTILIPAVETSQAGVSFKRFQSAAIISPENVKYISGDLLLPAAPDDPPDGPYTPLPAPPTPIPDTFSTVPVLMKRYTANFSISEEVRAVDLVYKNIFPTAKLFMKVGKNAKVGIYSEKASDSTKVRTASVVGATSINVLDVTPWKTGPDLLTGRLRVGALTGPTITDSEVRDLLSADFSTSGNSITLTAADTGTTTLVASGATLSGGSTSAQASGTLTVGGTPAAGDTITGTIDGEDVEYTLTSADTTETAAAMLMQMINANTTLRPYIRASWLAASPTVVTVKCLHGALNLTSTTGFPTFLKAHDVGEEVLRIAMSLATNSQDVYSAWPTSTLVLLNDIYLPTVLNGHKYQATSITTGITGTAHPTMPTSAGGTVVDGGVTWTEIGSTVLAQAGLKRANIVKDSFKWPLGSTQSSVNQIKGKFRDKVNDFAETPFKVNDAAHQAQVKKIYPKEIDLTAVDNFHQVFRLASAALAKDREGDWFASLEAGPSALVLEEGDLICVSDDSGGLVNVVTRIEDLRIKPNHHVAIERSRLYSTNMFSDDVTATPILIPSTLRHTQTADSVIAFIDNFAIRDADALTPGFYIAVSRDLAIQGDWRGWKLYADYGDGYVYLGVFGDVAATMGTADTILGTTDFPDQFDTGRTITGVDTADNYLEFSNNDFTNNTPVQVSNSGGALPAPLVAGTTYFVRDKFVDNLDSIRLSATLGGAVIDLTTNGTGTNKIKRILTFTLKFGTPEPAPEPFATVTEADLIANPRRNLFLVGGEYLQAATIVSNGDQSYTVSDFYRGRRSTDTTALSHDADEDVIYLNGAEKFVPIDPARAGIAYNYKAVTLNQNVSDANAVSFTWDGGTVVSRHVANLDGTRTTDGDWYFVAEGNPYPHEKPETYMIRIRRTSDDVIMRDIPVTPGINIAALFRDLTGDATVVKNNIYGTDDVTPGTAHTIQEIHNEGMTISAALTVPDSACGVSIQFGGTKFVIGAEYLDGISTDVVYRDWAAGTPVHVTVPSVGGVVYVRVILVGTELKFFWGGSPITETHPPNAILRDVPDFPSPAYLRFSVQGINAKAENVVLGGMNEPQTIYTIEQQENDNTTGLSTVDAEMWQVSRYEGIVGQSMREVFP